MILLHCLLYSDAKLTSLLRDELGGNCKTQALVCMKPQSDSNTLAATLRLASQLSQIKNYPIINDPFSQVRRLLYKYETKYGNNVEQ